MTARENIMALPVLGTFGCARTQAVDRAAVLKIVEELEHRLHLARESLTYIRAEFECQCPSGEETVSGDGYRCQTRKARAALHTIYGEPE